MLKLYWENSLHKYLTNMFIVIFMVCFFTVKMPALLYLSSLYLLLHINYKILLSKPIIKDKVFLFIIGLLCVELISSFFALDIKDALSEWRKQYVVIIVFGLFLLSNYKTITFEFIYKLIVIAFFIIEIFYLKETFYLNHSFDFIHNVHFATPRDITFIIPILTPIIIYGLFLFYKNIFFTILSIIVILVSLFMILLAGSRGAYLSYSIELLIFFIYIIYILYSNKKYMILLILSVVSLSLFFTIFNINNAKFESALRRGFSTNGRVAIWKSYQDVLKDRMFIGIGMGQQNMNDCLIKYKVKSRSIHRNNNKLLEQGLHNRYLTLLYESGIFALVLYLLIIGLSLKRLVSFKNYFLKKQNIISLVFITILVEHFIIRGMVEALKFNRFYFVMFLMLALYYNELEKDNQ